MWKVLQGLSGETQLCYDALVEQCMTWLINPDLLLFLCFLWRLFFATHVFHAMLLHSEIIIQQQVKNISAEYKGISGVKHYKSFYRSFWGNPNIIFETRLQTYLIPAQRVKLKAASKLNLQIQLKPWSKEQLKQRFSLQNLY